MTFADVLVLVSVRAASYVLVCTGFAVVFGSAGILNLTHGVFYVAAAYLAYGAGPSGWGWPPGLAWAGSFAATSAAGYAFFRAFLRPIANDPVKCMVVCLGANLVFTEVLKAVSGTSAVPVPRLVEGTVTMGALRISLQQAIAVPVAAGTAAVAGWVLARTRAGRVVRAVAQDRETAAALGIRTEVVAGGAFVASIGLVALAAGLLTPDQVVTPTSWVGPLVKSFAVVVAGGARSVRAVTVAALVLAAAEVTTALTISEGAAEYVGLAAVLVCLAAQAVRSRAPEVR